MNERIRGLAVEATKYSNTLMIDYLDLSDEDYKEKYNQEYNKKFAELIVDEVYDYILNATFDDEPWPDRKDVKKHFGVEE